MNKHPSFIKHDFVESGRIKTVPRKVNIFIIKLPNWPESYSFISLTRKAWIKVSVAGRF